MTEPAVPALPLFRDPLWVVYAFVVVGVALPARLIIGPLGGLGAPATLLTVAAGAMLVLAMLRPGTLVPGFHPVLPALVAFGISVVVSFAVGMTKPLSGIETAGSMRTLITTAGLIALGLLVASALQHRAHLDRLLGIIVSAATGLALLGIVQFLTGAHPDSYISVPGLTLQDVDISLQRSMFVRVQATTLHPIEFGVVLAVVLPLALHFATHGIAGRPPSRWRWLPVVVILVASPMAVSRSSVIGIAVGALFLVVTWPHRHRIQALLAGAVLAVAMRAAFPGLLGTLKSMFLWVEEDPSVEGRQQDYPRVLEYFLSDPWLGRGLGSFVPTEHFFVDNEYLLRLITGGLLGVGALLALFVTAISAGRGVYHHGKDPATRALGQALAASAAVSAVTWLTYDGMGFRLNAGLTFILFGAVGALWRMEVRQVRWGRGVQTQRPTIQGAGLFARRSEVPAAASLQR